MGPLFVVTGAQLIASSRDPWVACRVHRLTITNKAELTPGLGLDPPPTSSTIRLYENVVAACGHRVQTLEIIYTWDPLWSSINSSYLEMAWRKSSESLRSLCIRIVSIAGFESASTLAQDAGAFPNLQIFQLFFQESYDSVPPTLAVLSRILGDAHHLQEIVINTCVAGTSFFHSATFPALVRFSLLDRPDSRNPHHNLVLANFIARHKDSVRDLVLNNESYTIAGLDTANLEQLTLRPGSLVNPDWERNPPPPIQNDFSHLRVLRIPNGEFPSWLNMFQVIDALGSCSVRLEELTIPFRSEFGVPLIGAIASSLRRLMLLDVKFRLSSPATDRISLALSEEHVGAFETWQIRKIDIEHLNCGFADCQCQMIYTTLVARLPNYASVIHSSSLGRNSDSLFD